MHPVKLLTRAIHKMPFKPKANKHDYPETFSSYPENPDWVAKHQEENMIQIIGEDMFRELSRIGKEPKDVLRELSK